MPVVFNKSLAPPPPDRREILRYAGAREESAELATLLDECLEALCGELCFKVCYCEFPLAHSAKGLELGFCRVQSLDLQKVLVGCESVLVFAATLGVAPDRLIARYSSISPAKALLLDAIATERIEALCDSFAAELAAEKATLGLVTRPRFSPGYGDLPLALQQQLLFALDAPRRIGLTLNESLLMSPTKSVTALVGIAKAKERQHENH